MWGRARSLSLSLLPLRDHRHHLFYLLDMPDIFYFYFTPLGSHIDFVWINSLTAPLSLTQSGSGNRTVAGCYGSIYSTLRAMYILHYYFALQNVRTLASLVFAHILSPPFHAQAKLKWKQKKRNEREVNGNTSKEWKKSCCCANFLPFFSHFPIYFSFIQ